MPPNTSHTAGFTRTVDDLWPNRLARGKKRFRNELAKLREPGQIAGDTSQYVNRLAQMGTEERLRNASAMGVPVASDVAGLAADAMMYARDPESRTPGNALLSGLGLLPIIPAMTAYHGSPHKFDKFELSDKTIGTGEGAQAYGHGLYFAEDPSVARSYQSSLSDTDGVQPLISARQSAIDTFKKRLANGADPEVYGPQIKAMESEIAELQKNLKTGSLYHVDIPDDRIAQMLDWDAPLSEQPEAVRKALTSALAEQQSNTYSASKRMRQLEAEMQKFEPWQMNGANFAELHDEYTQLERQVEAAAKGWPNVTGGEIYNMLSGGMVGQRAASERLRSAGIPGIRYLDGGSRGKGDGTRNFVVFDDSILKILNRE